MGKYRKTTSEERAEELRKIAPLRELGKSFLDNFIQKRIDSRTIILIKKNN